MRIGHSFDTDHDLTSFRQYEDRFGTGKVVLIKRHPWFFITGFPYFFYIIVLLICTALLVDRDLISVSSLFFYVHAVVLLLLVAANFFLLAAHIHNPHKLPVSNFFSLTLLAQKKNKAFRFRMLLFFAFYVTAVGLLIAAMIEGRVLALINSARDILLIVGHSFAQLCMLYWITRIIAVYINYEMDHIIITPEFIEIVDQKGLFHQHNRIINWNNVFSFEIVKKGFFASMMNIGKLLILGEPFASSKNIMTTFMYVADPEVVENTMHSIVGRGQKD